MQVLNDLDHEYHLFIDWKYRPWGDKSHKLSIERIEKGCTYLLDQGVDILIVPPLAEIYMKDGSLGDKILPLFQNYISEYVLKYSIIGKLGLLLQNKEQKHQSEEIMKKFITTYSLTDNQKNTKKFNQKFPLWTTCVRMWTYFLTTYGRRDPMVRKTIKHDLRVFKDAGVDTIVPMNWGFLFYQKIIKQQTNWKKIRFHGLDAVKECFDELAIGHKLKATSYSMTLHYTDRPTPLLEEKKWMQVLSRGGDIEVRRWRLYSFPIFSKCVSTKL